MKPINAKSSIRAKAWYIDMAFFIPFCFIELIVCFVVLSESFVDYLFESNLIFLILIIPYIFINEFFTKNGSLGKKIMKIKIINEENYKRPNKLRLLLRGIGNLLTALDILFCYRRIDRRSLGDVISKTRVIYATADVLVKCENINLEEQKWGTERVAWDDSNTN